MHFRSLLLLSLLSLALFVPAYAQTQKLDLTGTEWVGDDHEDVTTFVFEKGGILAYFYNGNSYRNGTWSQDGTSVAFEMNKGYRTFKGKIDKDTITGTSENTAGLKWGVTMYRYNRPQCSPKDFSLGGACGPAQPPAKKVSKKPRRQ